MFLQDHLGTIIFYSIIILLLIINRKKFDKQAKIIFLYRTKIGIKFMEKFSRPKSEKWDLTGRWLFYLSTITVLLIGIPLVFRAIFEGIIGITLPDSLRFSPEMSSILIKAFSIAFLIFLISVLFFKQIRKAGVIGIYVGYFGMLLIVVTLFKGLMDTFFVPNAPAALQPVIPGVNLPGSSFHIPLISGWLALFLVIVVHEFSHGIVSKAHNLPIKASGIVFFGPLMGAFVEPDEKKLVKANGKVQNSIYAAGPFSNVLLTILVFMIMLFVINPLATTVVGEPNGFEITHVNDNSPADNAGLNKGMVFTEINGDETLTITQFLDSVENTTPGETLIFGTGTSVYEVVTTEHPDDNEKSYIGINLEQKLANDETVGAKVYLWIAEFLMLTLILSLGIGLANLLPIGPVDGGRMFNIVAVKWWGKEKGHVVFTKVSIIIFLIILFLLVWPLIRGLFTQGV